MARTPFWATAPVVPMVSTWTQTSLWAASRRTRLPCEHQGGWGTPDPGPLTLVLTPDSYGRYPGGPSDLRIAKWVEGSAWVMAVPLI